MPRSLVVKVTAGLDAPERCNQAFTVASVGRGEWGRRVAVAHRGGGVVRAARPRRGGRPPRGGAACPTCWPRCSPEGTVTVCSQCAARRSIGEDDVLDGRPYRRIAGVRRRGAGQTTRKRSSTSARPLRAGPTSSCPGQVGSATSTSAIAPRWATTARSTGTVRGASVRSVQRPGRREEAELAGRRRRHLRGELAASVEQPHVRTATGEPSRTTAPWITACVSRSTPAVDAPRRVRRTSGATPSPGSSPRTTGTPTSEPYSVHDPS